jgi:hypothetical protein
MTIQDGMDSALTVVVIQRADTRTPMTMIAVVTGDELDLTPLLPRRSSNYVAALSLEEKRGTGVKPCRILRID